MEENWPQFKCQVENNSTIRKTGSSNSKKKYARFTEQIIQLFVKKILYECFLSFATGLLEEMLIVDNFKKLIISSDYFLLLIELLVQCCEIDGVCWLDGLFVFPCIE
jgi:hypothetical protein